MGLKVLKYVEQGSHETLMQLNGKYAKLLGPQRSEDRKVLPKAGSYNLQAKWYK